MQEPPNLMVSYLWQVICLHHLISIICDLLTALFAGGFDDNAPLESVESYDSTCNQWTLVAQMSCPRGGVGIAALAGKIYAVGGHDGSNYLSSVEQYDPETDMLEYSSS